MTATIFQVANTYVPWRAYKGIYSLDLRRLLKADSLFNSKVRAGWQCLSFTCSSAFPTLLLGGSVVKRLSAAARVCQTAQSVFWTQAASLRVYSGALPFAAGGRWGSNCSLCHKVQLCHKHLERPRVPQESAYAESSCRCVLLCGRGFGRRQRLSSAPSYQEEPGSPSEVCKPAFQKAVPETLFFCFPDLLRTGGLLVVTVMLFACVLAELLQ